MARDQGRTRKGFKQAHRLPSRAGRGAEADVRKRLPRKRGDRQGRQVSRRERPPAGGDERDPQQEKPCRSEPMAYSRSGPGLPRYRREPVSPALLEKCARRLDGEMAMSEIDWLAMLSVAAPVLVDELAIEAATK